MRVEVDLGAGGRKGVCEVVEIEEVVEGDLDSFMVL